MEHFECPEGVDYGEVFNTLMDYIEALTEQGLPDSKEEWERRYMEELEARGRQKLPVHA